MSLPDILARIRARGFAKPALTLWAEPFGLSASRFDPAREIYGDVVEIPAAAKSGGGDAARGSSRGRTNDIAHRGEGPTR